MIINCNKCEISKTRKNIVIGRGSIPADILFIGEAPGESEDLIGEPFIGRSGKFLDEILKEVNLNTSYYITNCVLCRPIDSKGGNRQPTPIEILDCRKNILQIIKQVKPKKVCFIGKVARTFYEKLYPEGIDIFHPAFILRSGGRNSFYFRETVKKLKKELI